MRQRENVPQKEDRDVPRRDFPISDTLLVTRFETRGAGSGLFFFVFFALLPRLEGLLKTKEKSQEPREAATLLPS